MSAPKPPPEQQPPSPPSQQVSSPSQLQPPPGQPQVPGTPSTTTPSSSSMTELKLDSGTVCSAAAACLCCCIFALLAISLTASLLVSIFSTLKTPTDEYVKWAVNVDAKECAQVAKEIVDDGGAIGDIAVAVMLCMGVTAPHLVGIGGGFIALFYNKTSRQVRTLNSLGRSPSAAKPDIFSDAALYKYGATASIVPGAVEGYGRIHKELGELEWYRLFDPAIRLAREGFTIGPYLGQTLERHSANIEANADLKTRFWNTASNTVLKNGDQLVQGALGDTLSDLAIHGAQYMYTGELAKDIIDSVKQGGGIMSDADLSGYTSEWTKSVSVNLSNGLVFQSAPIPGSGTLLGAAVAQISLDNAIFNDPGDTVSQMTAGDLHRLVERLKFAYARRADFGDEEESRNNEYQIFTEIIDKINKTYDSHRPLADAEGYGLKHVFAQDYGGAHVCIIAPSGDAFSITSSLNNEFGSMFTTSSGLLLNNYMDAFVKHASEGAPTANLLGPSKTPMTSMAPVIITKVSSITPVHSVFGGSGGMAGVSAVAQLLTCASKYAYHECALNEARVHPELVSMKFVVNVAGKDKDLRAKQKLKSYGHEVSERFIPSTAIGIMPTRRATYLVLNDTKHIDGGNTGGSITNPEG
ncbi:glutathione hydrolase 1 proenzyme [Rhipicephalus sanguineus]|uniref:glutathione hydrolase 1 proenzyme n=1 Tax=Rhipicephalus sanguineus TaxID=34632 RepID=UPI0020C3EB8A|nr:glutathione hydrolase 1 proenzyme [Rhipicephalus sanguineus]